MYVIFTVNIYSHSIAVQMQDGQCPSHGNASILICCLNYIDIGGECIACQPGTMGLNCTRRCPDGFYGQFCVKPCDCLPTQRCSKAFGCVHIGRNGTRGSEESDEMISLHSNSCKSLEAAVISQGVVIGLLFVALVSVTVHLYRLQPPHNKPSGYTETHIKFEEIQLHSYEAMKGNDLADVARMENMNRVQQENYLEPISPTRQHLVCNKQKGKGQGGIYEPNDPRRVSSAVEACPPKVAVAMESFKSNTANISPMSEEKNESYTEIEEKLHESDQYQRDSYLDVEPDIGERENYLGAAETSRNQRKNYLDVIASEPDQGEKYLDVIESDRTDRENY